MFGCEGCARAGGVTRTFEATLPASGPAVADRYELCEILGFGTFSVVRRAVELDTGRNWACKTLCVGGTSPKDGRRSPEYDVRMSTREAATLEVRMLQKVQNEGVVQYKEHFDDGAYFYIILELLEGPDLLSELSQFGRFDEASGREIFRSLLLAVSNMHREGVLHRDIKVENIMLVQQEECGDADTPQCSAKLIDFGLARPASHEPIRELCGSLASVAPEVLANAGYGNECDMWSLGVILFNILSGELPFHGQDTIVIRAIMKADYRFSSPVWHDVSAEARDLVSRLLQINTFLRLTADEALRHPWLLDL